MKAFSLLQLLLVLPVVLAASRRTTHRDNDEQDRELSAVKSRIANGRGTAYSLSVGRNRGGGANQASAPIQYTASPIYPTPAPVYSTPAPVYTTTAPVYATEEGSAAPVYDGVDGNEVGGYIDRGDDGSNTPRTCPTSVSPIYQNNGGAVDIVACTTNSDCALYGGCCLHPWCICGQYVADASVATCTTA